jgi:hypothetical protein
LIAQYTNFLETESLLPVPKTGISRKILVRLFVAKCQDLQITSSKQQMIRFIETFESVNGCGSRRLNLADMGLGDLSMKIIGEIIGQNKHSQIDLSKNIFTDSGLRTFVDAVASSHTIMSITLNANSITCEGAVYLFQSLQKNQTLTHLELANPDCLANKIKLGNRGAQSFSDYLRSSNCLLSIIDLAGAQLTSEAMMTVFGGITLCRSLVSLNLSSNNIGQQPSAFEKLITILGPSF